MDTFDTDSQVILEYLCAITERVKTHEARLIWIQTSMVFAKLDLVDQKRKVFKNISLQSAEVGGIF